MSLVTLKTLAIRKLSQYKIGSRASATDLQPNVFLFWRLSHSLNQVILPVLHFWLGSISGRPHHSVTDTEKEVAKQEMEPTEKWSKTCMLPEGAIESEHIVQRIYY